MPQGPPSHGDRNGSHVSFLWGGDGVLTVRERMTLTLAATPYPRPELYVAPARELLGYTETRFWQVALALLDRPDAVAEYPREVRRLSRLRDARRQARCGSHKIVSNCH